ncbi:MAG: hypothetical protein ACXW4M_15395 [Anaerolineales bacterium]
MSKPVLVQIVGAPIACKEGVKDSWREVARWVEGQLISRFGDAVQVKYYDLFDADCPPMSTGSQLPLVVVNSEVAISGGKISIPVIRSKITALLEKEYESSGTHSIEKDR